MSNLLLQQNGSNEEGTTSFNPINQPVPGVIGVIDEPNGGSVRQEQGTPNIPTTPPTNPGATTPVLEDMVMPEIGELCIGEQVTINNTNGRNLYIVAPNNDKMQFRKKESNVFEADHAGQHIIGYYVDGVFVQHSNFDVHAKPKADFTIDLDTKFENGLPTTHAQATIHGENFSWNAEGQTSRDENASFHFYEQGWHTIELEVSNGTCKTVVQKQVKVDQYNLMAMNAFNPYSMDPRNSTFMPYALTERNTNFTMMIIDSRDGGIVYETSDAGLPWDGTDKRTGKIENTITTYIWKVVLENPEPNEPAEYKGTIIKL